MGTSVLFELGLKVLFRPVVSISIFKSELNPLDVVFAGRCIFFSIPPKPDWKTNQKKRCSLNAPVLNPCRAKSRFQQKHSILYITWNMWCGAAVIWATREGGVGWRWGEHKRDWKWVFDCIWHEWTKTTFAFSCWRSLTGLLSQAVVVTLGRQLQIQIKASLPTRRQGI